MSSQAEGIPVRHNPSNAGYRLIELPAEVEAALTGPGAPVLNLESAEDNSTILRTPDRSYTVKQKNTSNTLFLLSSASSTTSSPQQGLETISMIHETVELEPVKPKDAGPTKPHTGSMGKWHEKFGKNR